MLQFLFGKKPQETVVESQRAAFERVTTELSEMIEALPVKPRVTFDVNTGAVAFEAPEQFPDEAKALPAPTTAPAEDAAPTEDAAPAQAA